MQLIKKIEIRYLRSLYTATIDETSGLNVFFGRNDSGKSNVLRALNLFFNDETDPGTYFDFPLDMSDLRKSKAAVAKGRQFVWIKLTIRVPNNYAGALGPEISIKKQWNRGGEVTFSSSPSFDGGKAGRLSRLLNEVDFTYIPAIKDISVYADLIERMYTSASENEAMLKATDLFIGSIDAQTKELTEKLKLIVGGNAMLAPPTDMATLFRNLDFSLGDEGHSLFKQKGDGIKARHLPELLRFINDHEPRKKFFIWGFEEPENSLDLSAASDEAERFDTIGRREDTQVFISSHSPAFYIPGRKSESARRYFIEKQRLDEDGEVAPANAVTAIDSIASAERKMSAAGLTQLPAVIRMMKESALQNEALTKKLHSAEADLAKLKVELESLTKPTIFIEGKHDISMLKLLIEESGYDFDLDVRSLGGTPQNQNDLFLKIAKSGGIQAKSKTLFLFDNDKSGRGSLRNLLGKKGASDGNISALSDKIGAMTIPAKDPRFTDFLNKAKINIGEAKYPAELLFATEDICHELDSAIPEDDPWRKSIHDDYYGIGQACNLRLQSFPSGSLDWLYARMVPNNMKELFWEKVAESFELQPHQEELAGTIMDFLE